MASDQLRDRVAAARPPAASVAIPMVVVVVFAGLVLAVVAVVFAGLVLAVVVVVIEGGAHLRLLSRGARLHISDICACVNRSR